MKDIPNIGSIITANAYRDAIHMAVAPVVAAHALIAGRHVSIDEHGQATEHKGKPIGIVDPFLKGAVQKGEKFWLFLYPGTITGLRHEWTHPAFAAEVKDASQKAASEKWMREWAVRHMGEDYYGDGEKRSEQAAYESAIEAGHNNHIGPYEDARDYIDNEWWNHWETITGKTGDREAYFSCSC